MSEAKVEHWKNVWNGKAQVTVHVHVPDRYDADSRPAALAAALREVQAVEAELRRLMEEAG